MTAATVHLYVYEGFADWEAAFAVAGLNAPDFQASPGRWRVATVAESGDLVRSMGGVGVLPDRRLADLAPEASAMLLLPGGPGWDDAARHADAIALARRFVDAGVPVGAICGATAGLARAGLLDERRHTSNALAYLKGVAGYGGSDRYEDRDAVADTGVVTAGGMAPVAFAREVFRLLGVYEPAVLEAWTALYTSGHSRHYAELLEAASSGRARP